MFSHLALQICNRHPWGICSAHGNVPSVRTAQPPIPMTLGNDPQRCSLAAMFVPCDPILLPKADRARVGHLLQLGQSPSREFGDSFHVSGPVRCCEPSRCPSSGKGQRSPAWEENRTETETEAGTFVPPGSLSWGKSFPALGCLRFQVPCNLPFLCLN